MHGAICSTSQPAAASSITVKRAIKLSCAFKMAAPYRRLFDLGAHSSRCYEPPPVSRRFLLASVLLSSPRALYGRHSTTKYCAVRSVHSTLNPICMNGSVWHRRRQPMLLGRNFHNFFQHHGGYVNDMTKDALSRHHQLAS